MAAPLDRKLAALRMRIEKGDFTLDRDELTRLAGMLEKLADRCGEAYQVVGSLAGSAGLMSDPAVIRALDLLSDPLKDGDMLPFATAVD